MPPFLVSQARRFRRHGGEEMIVVFAALFSWMPPALKVLVIAAVSFFGFIVVVKLVRIIIAFVSDAVALLKSFIPFI